MSEALKARPSVPAAGSQAKRERKPKKTYDHVLSEQEKFAVAIVMQARKACTIAIDAIRSGNGCSLAVLKPCSELSTAAASLLLENVNEQAA